MELKTHQEALEELDLQVGDTVKVFEKAKSHKRGWENHWIDKMDNAIGKTGVIVAIGSKNEGVEIEIDGVQDGIGGNYNYPAFILGKLINNIVKPSEPTTVLQEAESLIYGDREKDYGKTSDNFADIAKGWEVITKTTITPEQVGLMMAWLKICRANKDNCDKRDSLVDLAGYAGCIEKIKKNL